jgi:uncharacterized membrane protein YeaQ/YmgE (transglycosylase-associated protein family)
MFALTTILADGVTIRIGENVWTFGLSFIIYLVIAAIVGLIAETIVGWRLPFGIVGAVIAALVGIWLMTQVIIVTGIGDIYLGTNPQVPVIRALIGAIILVSLWHLLTYGLWRRRHRYYYRRA